MPAFILFAAAAAAFTPCPALKVHDGDTIRCGTERIRISNIDAPELRGSPSCRGWKVKSHWCDYVAGADSRDALKYFLARGPVQVQRSGHDKYGRTLAMVSVNGRDAGAYLVRQGLARWWR